MVVYAEKGDSILSENETKLRLGARIIELEAALREANERAAHLSDAYDAQKARHAKEIAAFDASQIDALATRAHRAEEQVAKLQAFKDYVHKRLDDAGVPADPESPHKAKGCRIGGRLDLVLAADAQTHTLEDALRRARIAVEHAINRPHEHNPSPGWSPSRCEVFDRAMTVIDAALGSGGDRETTEGHERDSVIKGIVERFRRRVSALSGGEARDPTKPGWDLDRWQLVAAGHDACPACGQELRVRAVTHAADCYCPVCSAAKPAPARAEAPTTKGRGEAVYLGTPCADCGHSFNWHCNVSAEDTHCSLFRGVRCYCTKFQPAAAAPKTPEGE